MHDAESDREAVEPAEMVGFLSRSRADVDAGRTARFDEAVKKLGETESPEGTTA